MKINKNCDDIINTHLSRYDYDGFYVLNKSIKICFG